MTPKSGRPVFGHTEVNSGSWITISYPGNWFGQVSISGNSASSPAAACSEVYLGGFDILYCNGSLSWRREVAAGTRRVYKLASTVVAAHLRKQRLGRSRCGSQSPQ